MNTARRQSINVALFKHVNPIPVASRVKVAVWLRDPNNRDVLNAEWR
jgi:hypothetical protein